MGDKDEGDTQGTLQFLQFHLHLLPEFQVQRTEWFVQQQDLGLHHQGAGKSHPLALAAGEMGRLAPDEFSELHALQGFTARSWRSLRAIPRTRSPYATLSMRDMCGNSA